MSTTPETKKVEAPGPVRVPASRVLRVLIASIEAEANRKIEEVFAIERDEKNLPSHAQYVNGEWVYDPTHLEFGRPSRETPA